MQWLAALAFISVPLAALLLVWFVSRGRLVRCPETGGLGLVDLEPAAERDAQAPAHRIRRCDLWPRRQACEQGCLARHTQPAAPYGVDLKALRPFQRA
jgi:hypothetical protein